MVLEKFTDKRKHYLISLCNIVIDKYINYDLSTQN